MTAKEKIEAKIKSIRTDCDKAFRETLLRTIGSQEYIKAEKEYHTLSGKIEAYEDVLAILRSGKYE